MMICDPTGVFTTLTAHTISDGQFSQARTKPPSTLCANNKSGLTSVPKEIRPDAAPAEPCPAAITGPAAGPPPPLAALAPLLAGDVEAEGAAGVAPPAPAPGAL
ncbi:hypothetical protein A7G45_31240 [Mycolicibacterium llatzerense]|nr:hypothetical protein [Mycolicibacterium llatzerense]